MSLVLRHFAAYRKSDGGFLCAYDAYEMAPAINIAIQRVNNPDELVQFEIDITQFKAPTRKAVLVNEEWQLVEDITKIAEANAILLKQIREHRRVKIAKTDWTQLSDVDLTSEEKLAWATYRQSLRDIPQNVDLNTVHHVSQINWPTPPA